jgi:hypothetical protein
MSFIPVLEEMAPPLMAQVKVDNIAGQKLLHTPGLVTCPNQQMEMVGKQAPGIDNKIPLQAMVGQPLKKILPVWFAAEDVCSLDAPAHYVMQSPGSIQPRLSGHSKKIRSFPFICQVVLEPTSPFFSIRLSEGFLPFSFCSCLSPG